ncbi:MAG: hypothetical protein KGH87_09520, partial [Thaumarchaeota archaeon]|nr:hypothetical protein [Nitrososphaerota archaeon]
MLDSVWHSVLDSVRTSVRDSEYAYIGTLFPQITTWKYVNNVKGQYPFQSNIELLKRGVIPVYYGKKWYLHGGNKMEILWSGNP